MRARTWQAVRNWYLATTVAMTFASPVSAQSWLPIWITKGGTTISVDTESVRWTDPGTFEAWFRDDYAPNDPGGQREIAHVGEGGYILTLAQFNTNQEFRKLEVLPYTSAGKHVPIPKFPLQPWERIPPGSVARTMYNRALEFARKS